MSIIEKILCKLLRFREICQAGKVYMRRFYLSPNIFGYRLALHHIMVSDYDRDPHDHPYKFWSFVLWGSYLEMIYTYVMGIHLACRSTIHRKRWSLVVRPAKTIHKINLSKPVWTLVLAGPTIRNWGFHTAKGFVSHLEYFVEGDT